MWIEVPPALPEAFPTRPGARAPRPGSGLELCELPFPAFPLPAKWGAHSPTFPGLLRGQPREALEQGPAQRKTALLTARLVSPLHPHTRGSLARRSASSLFSSSLPFPGQAGHLHLLNPV